MKNMVLFLGLLFTSSPLLAQVTVEVTFDQEQFLPGEAIQVAARITNLSGQPLHFGREHGWLTFAVESREGKLVAKTGEVPIEGDFVLESSKRAIVRADLAPHFNLSRPGHYTVSATVRIKEWNKTITSTAKVFDIIHGSKLWDREFGVPRVAGDTNALPEVRRYTLHQANYHRTQLRLYFQLSDSSGKVHKVTPIGPMVSFGMPEAQVDRLSRLHVLYQNGPRSFSYTVFSPDGEMVARQTYDFTSRPKLKADDEGNLAVAGGTRRVTKHDLPAPASTSHDVTTPNP